MAAPPPCPAAAWTHTRQHLLPDAAVVEAVHDGVEDAGGEEQQSGGDLGMDGVINLMCDQLIT